MDDVVKDIKVPISEKYNLTIDEAAAYFGIGRNRLYAVIKNNPHINIAMHIGKKTLIRRKQFERYIDGVDSL